MTIHTLRHRDLFGTSNDPLIGLRVRLERVVDQQQPCHDNVAEICMGRGPHGHALLCATCGQFRGWLPKNAAGFLLETIRNFGVPDTPVAWRDATRTD